MPDDLWHRIWLHGFWRPIEPDLWAHQPLADLVAYWAWGSGLHTAIRQVQRVVNRLHGTALTEDGVLGPRTRAAVRRAVASDWQQLYRELALQRCVFVAGVVRSRPEQLAHLAGWLRALTDFLLFQGVCVRSVRLFSLLFIPVHP
jgi:lysozyme family protein